MRSPRVKEHAAPDRYHEAVEARTRRGVADRVSIALALALLVGVLLLVRQG